MSYYDYDVQLRILLERHEEALRRTRLRREVRTLRPERRKREWTATHLRFVRLRLRRLARNALHV